MRRINLRHPVREAGGTAQHVKAFEAVAIGQVPRCHPQTLEWLVNHGLVERLPDRVVGKDRFGVAKVPNFQVPLLFHAAWCAWAAQQ